MARGGSGSLDQQPSLFRDDELPKVARQKQTGQRGTQRRVTSPTSAYARASGSSFAKTLRSWLMRVLTEGAHKFAVGSVQKLMLVVVIGLAVGIVTVLQLDPLEKLQPYWRYVDMIEKGIFAKRLSAAQPSNVDTGGVTLPAQRPPASPPPPEPAPAPKPDTGAPPSWTVDVFPERD